MRRALVRLVLTFALSACAARPAPPVPSIIPPPDGRDALVRDLDALFATPAVAHAQWGVRIDAPASRRTLYGLNASRFMIPASTQKLLTAAAAVERLGWGYRYTTRLVATAPVGADGVIEGDLVVVGDGDPTINPRHPARWRAFDDWAAALRRRGLTRVRGRVVGDDNAIVEPGWGAGWAWEDLAYGYGAPVSALQYHENQIDVIVWPGLSEGGLAIIGTAPIGSGMLIDNRVTTVPAGAATALRLVRIPGSAFLEVHGQIAAGAGAATLTAAVENPTQLYVSALKVALERHGIAVDGDAADIDALRDPPDLPGRLDVLVDYSPPLSEIVDVSMKWSRNIYAETLLTSLAPAGEPASAEAGLAPLQQALAAWGVPADSYRPRDGSGLSRYDSISADALTMLLTHAASSPAHAASFRATLPVAGVSGTLATRLTGTPAEGRVFAKTGTMSNVRALAGYLTTLDGDTLIFAIVVNNYRVPTADIDAIIDRCLLRLVDFRN